MNILIVEDSATLRHIMCQFIRQAGHTPIIAENGEQALQTLDSNSIDMVIMDIEMPGLDGFDTTRIMRDWMNQEGIWLPIIFVTGKAEEEDLKKGIEVGGDDYLIKPVSKTILIAKIRAMERIMAMRDELKRLNESLVELSERDSLTHLYNRRTFDERAETLWKQAARENTPTCILLMDIDHFKLYNDCYGHLAGDDCIKAVADTIQKSLNRPGDLLARYGGEEFIVMLPNTPREGGEHVAERIRRNVSRLQIEHKDSSTSDHVTLSLGGAVVIHAAGASLKDQIHAADLALYQSKQQGRNCATIKLFNPKVKILIADTSGQLSKIIDGKLQHFVALVEAHNQHDLMTLAETEHPDVIILHDNADQRGALSLAQALNHNGKTSLIPLIAVSESQKSLWKEEAKQVEAEACFTDSEARECLVNELNRMLF